MVRMRSSLSWNWCISLGLIYGSACVTASCGSRGGDQGRRGRQVSSRPLTQRQRPVQRGQEGLLSRHFLLTTCGASGTTTHVGPVPALLVRVCGEVLAQEGLQHRPQPALRPVGAAVPHQLPRVAAHVLERHSALQTCREDGTGARAANLGLLAQNSPVPQRGGDPYVVWKQATAGGEAKAQRAVGVGCLDESLVRRVVHHPRAPPAPGEAEVLRPAQHRERPLKRRLGGRGACVHAEAGSPAAPGELQARPPRRNNLHVIASRRLQCYRRAPIPPLAALSPHSSQGSGERREERASKEVRLWRTKVRLATASLGFKTGWRRPSPADSLL